MKNKSTFQSFVSAALRFILWAFTIGSAAAVIACCTVFPRRKVDAVFSAPELISGTGEIGLIIEKPTINYSEILPKDNFPYKRILASLAKKYNFQPLPAASGGSRIGGANAAGGPDENLILNISIDERRFLQAVETWYSVTAAVSFSRAGMQKHVLSVTYVEESKQPLTNSYRLYRVLEIIMEEAANVLYSPAE